MYMYPWRRVASIITGVRGGQKVCSLLLTSYERQKAVQRKYVATLTIYSLHVNLQNNSLDCVLIIICYNILVAVFILVAGLQD